MFKIQEFCGEVIFKGSIEGCMMFVRDTLLNHTGITGKILLLQKGQKTLFQFGTNEEKEIQTIAWF